MYPSPMRVTLAPLLMGCLAGEPLGISTNCRCERSCNGQTMWHGLPGRLKCGARASTALHPTTTLVGYKYPWWACLQVFTTSGGPPMGNVG